MTRTALIVLAGSILLALVYGLFFDDRKPVPDRLPPITQFHPVNPPPAVSPPPSMTEVPPTMPPPPVRGTPAPNPAEMPQFESLVPQWNSYGSQECRMALQSIDACNFSTGSQTGDRPGVCAGQNLNGFGTSSPAANGA